MRLLVVGISGQVGDAVARAADRARHTVLGGYASRPPPLDPERAARVDKTDPGAMRTVLERLRPDAVVDTGALHHVDYCESHPEEAMRVNRDGSAALAAAAAAVRAGYLFVSTDYVFDGTGRPPYREEDAARPLSVYGRSKLEGERAVLSAHPTAVVVRPSVIYSWVPPRARRVSASQKSVNFGSWAVDQLTKGEELRIVDDQIGSPTAADDLAEAILALLESGAQGVFHTAGATRIDRYRFTRELARALGFDPEKVRAVSTESLHQSAPRPPDSSLDSARLAKATGHAMWELPDALARFAKRWRAEPG